jgi:hypothetical protein
LAEQLSTALGNGVKRKHHFDPVVRVKLIDLEKDSLLDFLVEGVVDVRKR